MPDLTVIYMTTNQLPKHWVDYQLKILKRAAGDYPGISVSRRPMDLGTNIIDDGEQSHHNMYKQLLRACKVATTDFIATAEDDVLYTKEHFNFYRPPLDTIAYDMSRWSLYYWTPIYSIKQRISNCTLIAPRLEYIDALEERLTRMTPERPELISEVGRYEKNLRVKPRKIQRVYSAAPVVQFNHPSSTDHVAKEARKRLGQIKAYDVPTWGPAQGIIDRYYGKA